jgi:hypothetical protein
MGAYLVADYLRGPPVSAERACRHGGYGFQSSWGSARLAFELLQGALARGEAARDELNATAAPGIAKDGVGARSW